MMRSSFQRLSLLVCLIFIASFQIQATQARLDAPSDTANPLKRRLSPDDHSNEEILFGRRVTRTVPVTSSSTTSAYAEASTTLKSLFRSQLKDTSDTDDDTQSSEDADPDTVDPQHAVLRKRQSSQSSAFCTRFSTACSKVCKNAGKSMSTLSCMSDVQGGYGFKCKCSGSSTDYTSSALVSAANQVAVAVQAQTLTVTSTSTTTSTVSTTSTSSVIVSTTSTSLVSSTRTSVATSVPPASTVTQTVTSTSAPATVTNTLTSTRAPTTTTITKIATVDGGSATTTVIVAAAAASSKAISGNGGMLVGMQNSSIIALGQRQETDNGTVCLNKRSATFCTLYKQSCSTQCSSHGGVSSEKCSAVTSNVYSFSCKCNDGTSQSLHAMNAISTTTTTATTTTVTVTVTATVTTTRTRKATATATSTVVVTSTTRAATVTSTTTLPVATNTVTTTTSLPNTSTTTVQSTTTVPASSTVTATTTSTVTGAKTTVTVTATTTKATSTTLSKTSSSTSTTAKSASATSTTGFIRVSDSSTGQVYGLVGPNQDSNAYSFVLDPTSSNGIKVSITKSSLSSSLVALAMANKTVIDYYQPYTYIGLETESLSDSGLQPTLNEYLIITDTSLSSSSMYPSISSSDSGAYLAESLVWSYSSSTQKISPVWTNAKSSTPSSTSMQLWMLCPSEYDDCFMASAYNSSVWSNFDTDGISTIPVTWTFVPST